MPEFDLICSIVNSGQGSKVLRIAKNNGVTGGTIFLGVGTVKNKLLEFLDLDDIRKEIVFMAAEHETALKAVRALDKEMAFRKPNHGIAFTFKLRGFIGTKKNDYYEASEDRTVSKTVYNAVFIVVDKGRSDDVIEAGKAAGARGGTVIHARGSGIHETGILFAMPIEPEKDMVLILAQDDVTEAITQSIREKLEIDKPGNGVIFVLGVSEAFGLY